MRPRHGSGIGTRCARHAGHSASVTATAEHRLIGDVPCVRKARALGHRPVHGGGGKDTHPRACVTVAPLPFSPPAISGARVGGLTKAIQSEVAKAITNALDPEQPIDAGDALKVARAATADLTVTDALDRDPVTQEMIEARKPIPETAPAVAPGAAERRGPRRRADTTAARCSRRRSTCRRHSPAGGPHGRPGASTAARSAGDRPARRQTTTRAVRIVALEPPQRRAAARIEHETVRISSRAIWTLEAIRRSPGRA